jgi:CRISPR-associated protein Csd2
MTQLTNRYDFALLFDIKDGNPNGDPDAGNLPRTDPETSQGLVTDVCLKRKIRNYISLAKNGQAGFDIYVKEKAILTNQQGLAYAALGLDNAAASDEPEKTTDEPAAANKKPAKKPAKKASDGDNVEKARDWMCKHFFDIRTFGAVMSLKENNAGQVRGAVQLTFARSIDPIFTQEHSITRMAVATAKEAESQGGDNRTMGRKNTIPYGLYLGYGFVSPQLAAQTSFTEEDLSLLWEAFEKMFELDRSAARGLMSLQRLYIFKHASPLGNAPAHRLFSTIQVSRQDTNKPARDFSDYAVTLDKAKLPQGVELIVRPV